MPAAEEDAEYELLNRPSWLLGSWLNTHRFLTTAYYETGWVNKIDFDSSVIAEYSAKFRDLGLNCDLIVWIEFIVLNGLPVAFWVNSDLTCRLLTEIDRLA